MRNEGPWFNKRGCGYDAATIGVDASDPALKAVYNGIVRSGINISLHGHKEGWKQSILISAIRVTNLCYIASVLHMRNSNASELFSVLIIHEEYAGRQW